MTEYTEAENAEELKARDRAEIARNLAEVRREIAQARAVAAHSAGRVQLLAVSKTVEAERVHACWEAGPDGLAENKVQELLAKQAALPRSVAWHFMDSWHLAAEIEKRSEAADCLMEALVEINIGAEESKFGLSPEELWDFICACEDLPHLRIKGLMTVAPAVADPEEARPYFARLRQLLADMRRRAEKLGLRRACLQELSMGMSNDYRVAVEEGATMVRVGSRIFGARVYR